MRTGFTGWLAIILNAVALVPAGAHLFALPNKMRLSESDYFVVQSVYSGWQSFKYVFIAALVINIILAILLHRQRLPFVLSVIAVLCTAAFFAVFFIWTYPANQLTSNWTVIPSDWQGLRQQWEISHAANALIIFIGLCCVSWAALLSRPRG
ncbi:MAG: DUF1772 domain-containing protein [Methylocapsa sp.]|nr:DUF1772 domain-containing protein [Methylocapsa sp.]